MSIASENRQFFQSYDPMLLEEIEPGTPVQVEPARKEGVTMRIGGRYVHSRYAPARDARAVVAALETPPQKLHIHFGFGLGYFLNEDQPLPGGRVLIYEPDAAIAEAALDHVALAALFRNRGARLFCSKRRFQEYLFRFLKRDEPIRILISPFHRDHYPEQLRDFVDILKRERNRQGLWAGKGAKKMLRMFLESTLRSLKHTTRLPGIESLGDVFTGQPAVVVTAGPSLEKNVADLAPYRHRVLIFAIARTVRILDRLDIQPHFLVHTESKDFQYLIDGCTNLDQTTFLLADQCHQRFFHIPCKHRFVYQNPNNLATRWLNDHFPHLQKQYLATAGSVATEAFSIALFTGCNPIVLLGQDLALTGGRYYAAATTNQPFSHKDFERRTTPGYFGGRADTLANYLYFLDWYEDAVAIYRERYPERAFINATEGGAMIRGFENRKLREVAYSFFRNRVDPEPRLVKAIEGEANYILAPEDLNKWLLGSLQTVYAAQKLCRRFIPFRRTFAHELEGIGPQNLGTIQNHARQMDHFNRAIAAIYRELMILPGFCEEEPGDPGEGKGCNGDPTDRRALAAELSANLDFLAANFARTEKAAGKLETILTELVNTAP